MTPAQAEHRRLTTLAQQLATAPPTLRPAWHTSEEAAALTLYLFAGNVREAVEHMAGALSEYEIDPGAPPTWRFCALQALLRAWDCPAAPRHAAVHPKET